MKLDALVKLRRLLSGDVSLMLLDDTGFQNLDKTRAAGSERLNY
jgi:hypothetical protein